MDSFYWRDCKLCAFQFMKQFSTSFFYKALQRRKTIFLTQNHLISWFRQSNYSNTVCHLLANRRRVNRTCRKKLSSYFIESRLFRVTLLRKFHLCEISAVWFLGKRHITTLSAISERNKTMSWDEQEIFDNLALHCLLKRNNYCLSPRIVGFVNIFLLIRNNWLNLYITRTGTVLLDNYDMTVVIENMIYSRQSKHCKDYMKIRWLF